MTTFRIKPVSSLIINSDTKPSPEECTELRRLGFHFDRRGLYWFFESDVEPKLGTMEQIAAIVARIKQA